MGFADAFRPTFDHSRPRGLGDLLHGLARTRLSTKCVRDFTCDHRDVVAGDGDFESLVVQLSDKDNASRDALWISFQLSSPSVDFRYRERFRSSGREKSWLVDFGADDSNGGTDGRAVQSLAGFVH